MSRQVIQRILCVAFLAMMLTAFLLRLHCLSDVSVWYDESFEFRMVQFPPAEIIERVERDVQAPLHLFVLWLWKIPFGQTVASFRFSSLLFGMLSVLGACFLAAEAMDGDESQKHRFVAGLLAGAFISLSPANIYWSQTVRNYSMGICLTMWTSWLLLTWFRRRRPSYLVIYVILAVALTLQHNFGTFTVFGQLSFALCWAAVNARRTGKWSGFQSVLMTTWVTTSLWAVWLPSLLVQRANVLGGFWIKTFSWPAVPEVCARLFTDSTAIKLAPSHELIVFELTVLVVVLMLFSSNLGMRFLSWVAITTYAIILVISVLERNLMLPRYLLNFHACVLVGLAVLVARIPNQYFRGLIACCLLACFSATTYSCHQERTRQSLCPGMPEALKLVDSVRVTHEPLLVCNPMLFLNAQVHGPELTNIFTWGQKQQYPHFQGTAVMREGEYFDASKLETLESRWVWTLDAEEWLGGNWQVKLPPQWELKQERRIKEWYGWLVLRAYECGEKGD